MKLSVAGVARGASPEDLTVGQVPGFHGRVHGTLRMGAVTCWYRAAIPELDQPMISITLRSGTPRRSRTVAAVWRASWSRASRSPAAWRSFFHSP
jgi:hypothetical protein